MNVIAADEGICRNHKRSSVDRSLNTHSSRRRRSPRSGSPHRLRRRLAHICNTMFIVAEPAKDQISTKAGTDGVIRHRGRIPKVAAYTSA